LRSEPIDPDKIWAFVPEAAALHDEVEADVEMASQLGAYGVGLIEDVWRQLNASKRTV
jgi:hypothetical protein